MGAYDNQYFPVSTSEVAADNAVSSRAVLDLSRSVANYKANFGPVLIADGWPNEHCQSPTGDTNENIVLRWCPRFIGTYFQFRWAISGKMVSGAAGGDTTTWTIYLCENFYRGSHSNITSVEKAKFGYYKSSGIVISADTANSVLSSSEITYLPWQRNRYMNILVTATNTHASKASYLNAMNLTALVAE